MQCRRCWSTIRTSFRAMIEHRRRALPERFENCIAFGQRQQGARLGVGFSGSAHDETHLRLGRHNGLTSDSSTASEASVIGFSTWTGRYTTSSFRSTATTQAWSDESDLAFFYRAFGLSDFLLGDEENVTISLWHAFARCYFQWARQRCRFYLISRMIPEISMQVLLDFRFLLLVASGFQDRGTGGI